jgi:hypothetical protein
MGVRIGGSVGPVYASAPAGGCGKVVLIFLAVAAALSALYQYWPVALVVVVAACIGLRIWGVRAMRKQAREAAQAAAAGPQAKYSDRR